MVHRIYGFIFVSILLTILFLSNKNNNLKPSVTYKIKLDTVKTKTKIDPFFDYEYNNGDTSCFELVEDSLNGGGVGIRLRCVCPCKEFKTNKNDF